MQRSHDDPRWSLLEDARSHLIEAFSGDGVDHVEYVAAFGDDDGFDVWLGTATDTQREALRAQHGCLDRVRTVLLARGFSGEQLADLRIEVQSHETVDRDYEGSWFFAMR